MLRRQHFLWTPPFFVHAVSLLFCGINRRADSISLDNDDVPQQPCEAHLSSYRIFGDHYMRCKHLLSFASKLIPSTSACYRIPRCGLGHSSCIAPASTHFDLILDLSRSRRCARLSIGDSFRESISNHKSHQQYRLNARLASMTLRTTRTHHQKLLQQY